jgi:hypothetical protein
MTDSWSIQAPTHGQCEGIIAMRNSHSSMAMVKHEGQVPAAA